MPWNRQAELSLGTLEQRGHFWHHNVQLGTHPETGDSLIVSNLDRQAGTYFDGLSDAGKSSLLENWTVQDIVAGHAVGFLDPHGDSVDHIIAQVPLQHMHRIHLFDLTQTRWQFGLNLLHLDSNDPLARTRVCDRLLHCFQVLWEGSENQIYLPLHLRMAALALTYNSGSTLLDMERFLRDIPYRHLCLQNIQDISVQQHWKWVESLTRQEQERQLLPVQHRLALMFNGRPIIREIVGQARTTLKFRQAIENREVWLFKLPMQTLPTSPDFATMLSQARKYGLRATLANQAMNQLPPFLQDAVEGVHTKVCFRLNHDDAQRLAHYYETGDVVVREHDIAREPVRHLLHHETGNLNVQTFTDWYIRHLQTVERQNGRIVIERPGYRVEHLRYHLTNTEPPKDKLKEDNPTHDLNYLLREVMRTGDYTIPIPSQIVFGFANAGKGFYAYSRYHPIGGLLKADYQFPKHLVADQNGFRYWTRTPEDSREQLLHFLFHLRETMRYVASNPLGTATAVSASDIASMLTQLPKRAAFVRSGDDVGVIYTDDTLAMCDEEEFEARLTQVKVQTIQKYCHEIVPQLPGIPANPQPAKPQFRRYTEVI